MSTLKTHNLQSPDSGSANISLTPNAGMVAAGILTATSNVNVGSGITLSPDGDVFTVGFSTLGSGSSGGVDLHYQNVSRMSTASYGIAVNGSILIGDAIIHGGDSDTKISFPTNDTITAETAGTERVRITSEGTNVTGISTFNNGNVNGITFPLNVKQDNNDNDYDMGTGIKLQGGSSTEFYKWCALVARGENNGVGGYSNSQGLAFYTYNNYGVSGGTEKLRITGGGKVGIGIDDPDAKLEVRDAASTGIIVRCTSTQSTDSNKALRVRNNSDTNTFSVSHKGLLEIARGEEGSYLKVGGDDASNGRALTFTSSTGGTGSNGALHTLNATSGNGAIALATTGTERFRIASAGQIGLSGTNYGTAGQVLASGGSSAAPSWSGGARRVLEVVSSPCDGSTIATSNGNVTFENVTGQQSLSTGFADITGSKITYTPPTGTTQVIYEFNFQASRLDALAISHYRMYIAGTEVTYARSEIAGEDVSVRTTIRWIFNIGGSTNNATGRQSSWTSGKEIKLQAEDYGGSYDVQLHETNWWNNAGTDVFCMPTLSLTAIGV